MKKAILGLAIFGFLAFGVYVLLGGMSIRNRIIKAAEEKFNTSDNCNISIKDVTNFPWDKMYVFKRGTAEVEIEKALGFDYNTLESDYPLLNVILFVRDQRVVRHEIHQITVETPEPLSFKFPEDVYYMAFTPKDAVFQVRREKYERYDDHPGYYYELSPLSGPYMKTDVQIKKQG